MNNLISPDFSDTLRAVKSSDAPHRMMSVRRDGNQTHVEINSSSLGLIQTCMRKTQYSLHQGWRAKSGSPALIFGSAVHKGLETFYSYSGKDREIPEDFERNVELMARGHDAPEQHILYEAIASFMKAAEPLAGLAEHEPRSLYSGAWMMSKYFIAHAHDAYMVHSDEHGPLVERTFAVPFIEKPDLKIDLFGTIDLIMRNEATGEILASDHKTASRLSDDYLNRVKPNSQYTCYVYGALHGLGIDSPNFMVNVLEVKAKPKTDRGMPPKFLRQITRRTEEDFKELADVVEYYVRSYLRSAETGIWPLGDVNACTMYRACNYLDVCAAPNELRQNMLEAQYERNV